MSDRRKALAWEARWSMPTAIATFAAIALLIIAVVVATSFGGGGEAESLAKIDQHGGSVTLASLLQGLGFLLFAVPLVFLFRAALLRSERMRSQFLPLVVVAPLALAAGAVINGVAAKEAASDFTAGKSKASLSVKEATRECHSEQKEDASGFRDEFGKGATAMSSCVGEKRENDAATNAIEDSSLRSASKVIELVGGLALAFALAYCSLHALRTGLLTRFWGSLGIALGIAVLLGLLPVALFWFAYVGLLAAGWLPGGRPPAWAAGEAIPWPSPGEKAATELSPPADPADGNAPSPAEEKEDPTDTGQSR
jgi:hypothetical protein